MLEGLEINNEKGISRFILISQEFCFYLCFYLKSITFNAIIYFINANDIFFYKIMKNILHDSLMKLIKAIPPKYYFGF